MKCKKTHHKSVGDETGYTPAARDSCNDENAEKYADGFVTKICDYICKQRAFVRHKVGGSGSVLGSARR